MTDTKKSILKSAGQFFTGTSLSRVTGLIRDMTMAFAFGAGASVAAFFVAYRLAHLLRRMIGEGALQSAFIPTFEELRHADSERATKFYQNLHTLLTRFLFLLIGTLMSVIGCVLYWVDLSPGNREIGFLTILMLPSLLFICLYGLNTALLQCEKRYFIPGVAPVLFNISWITGILLIWTLGATPPMAWLSIAIIVGCFFQWLITVPRGKRTPFEWNPDLLKFGKPLALGILGVSAGQVNNALDALFARYAQSDGPALLWYALRLQQAPLGLFGIALSGAILPPLARAFKSKDYGKYRQFLVYGLKKTVWIMLPATLFLLFFSDILINLIYGRGHFTSSSIVATTPCLQAYSLGLLPMAITLILAPSFYSRGDYRTPTIASFVSVILNISLNGLFVLGLGWGAVSVALATAASSWVNMGILALRVGTLKFKAQCVKI